MKREKINTNKVKFSKLLFVFSLFLFGAILFQLVNLSLSDTVNGVDLKKFANNRNTRKLILPAYRGTIFNINGEPLAQTVDSYTVIAYLNESRTKNIKRPQHVVDTKMTAEALAPLLDMSVERILALLNKKNLYQVELGPGGNDITELKKEMIEKLELPGIDFIATYKRYYPNNDFLSYTLGYVQKHDENLVGEMGIEKYYDEILKGEDGYLQYQQDLNGYKIPNTPEIKKDEVDGMDIYLTIDGNIQMFIERAVKDAYKTYDPDWFLMVVADAKTGKILGTSSSPSFNPNTKNITSYLNPLVSYAFEPGSTMKIFSYMTALEKGTYDGNATFYSGNKKIGEDTIFDWNIEGWGHINYDRGFTLSSNVGVSHMMEKFINKNDLKDYYKLLGFGQPTGLTLPAEVHGKINFNYKIEVANAAFGQGITTTPIQFIQALTSIANDGVMLKPYIVDKIVNPNTDEIVFQGTREVIKTVADKKTVAKIKDLMFDVVNLPYDITTGAAYKMDGYDIIGKTGTAQYVDPKTGQYYRGTHTFIRSFAGMFPKDNPEVIIYTVVKRASYGKGQAVALATKKVITDLAKYLNIIPQVSNENDEIVITYEMPNLINKNIHDALKTLSSYNNKITVIGDGNKIIKQYPDAYLNVNNKDRVFIVTNSKNIIMPNIYRWSSRDVYTFCNLADIECQLNGYGYVYSQSIPKDTLIKEADKLVIELQNKID